MQMNHLLEQNAGSQQGNSHNVQHLVKNYQTCDKAGKMWPITWRKKLRFKITKVMELEGKKYMSALTNAFENLKET